MQLHISPSLRHVTVLPSKGVKEFIKVKVVSRRLSYRVLVYSLLAFMLFRFTFLLTAVNTIHEESKCSGIGCLGRKIGPRILGRQPEPKVTQLEQRTRTAKIQEYFYRHVASSSIPKELNCLDLVLANEHSTNANARLQLPSPERVPALVDNSLFHFVLASDNVLAASVVASSLVKNSFHPEKVVLHVITDRKTYSPMQAWFSLHPLAPEPVAIRDTTSGSDCVPWPRACYRSLLAHARARLPGQYKHCRC